MDFLEYLDKRARHGDETETQRLKAALVEFRPEGMTSERALASWAMERDFTREAAGIVWEGWRAYRRRQRQRTGRGQ